jgi:signal peptidase I
VSNRRGLVWTVGIIVAGGLFVRATLLDPWRVPDDLVTNAALAPTLGAGDLVLVAKHGKGGFGDLVRCADPEDATKFVVGRVAGADFDNVETQGGSLVVNGKRYDPGLSCPKPTFTIPDPGGDDDPIELTCGMVEMGGGTHMRATGGRAAREPKTERRVPNGSYFLLSDSRDLHQDSRDYGYVDQSTCHTIMFRLWSKAGWSDDDHRLNYIR